MKRSASFSDDRSKRFDLVRDWRDEIGAPDKTLLLGLLNPSKAGEEQDDPTVRKSVGFARRWGFGRVVLVNLNPIVSTDPSGLPPWSGLCMMNRNSVRIWAACADMVAVAWGSPRRSVCKTIAFSELVREFRANTGHQDLYCIGTTQDGSPLHPSRTAYTLAPVLWRAEQ